MNGINDTQGEKPPWFNDYHIPLQICETYEADWRPKILKYYCPKFDQNHFLHGGLIASKFSWLGINLHVCDNSDAAREKRI
jgi:hypothetical protein